MLDLREPSPDVWMDLGEAQSKCEHISGVPLKPEVANRLHEVYLVKGAQATTAIEGNTLTEDQVRLRLQGKLDLPPSKEYLGKEIDNVGRAFEKILGCLTTNEPIHLNVDRIREYNRMVLDGLETDGDTIPGHIRDHEVHVGVVYQGAPSEDCEYLLGRMCEWLNSAEFCRDDGKRIAFGLLRATMAHLYLAWIHPFGDGNGSTARLVEYEILLNAGVPTPACHLLSNHYNLTRQRYYRELRRASESGGNVVPFIQYAVQGFLDGLKEHLAMIRYLQWDIAWRDYVYERFERSTSAADKRRRDLVIDLSRQVGPVAQHDIRRLTPRIAELYSRLSAKTLTRDLVDLVEEGMLERSPKGLRVRREIVLSFLPMRRNS